MEKKYIHVVAAVIHKNGNFLIAKRPENKHQGGLWEFPGGKVEADESPLDALKRELKEEINIHIESASVFLNIKHDYPDKSVHLEIFWVEHFSGKEKGNEGQEILWVGQSDINVYPFPAANKKILNALFCPSRVCVLPESFTLNSDIKATVKNLVKNNLDALLLRLPALSRNDYVSLFNVFRDEINAQNLKKPVRLLVNRPDILEVLECADGLHLSAKELRKFEQSGLNLEIPEETVFSSSCHNQTEIDRAERMDLDFIFLSPVLESETHPSSDYLGWKGAEHLCNSTELPVLLLGGMRPEDIGKAKTIGAFGVAGISGFNV